MCLIDVCPACVHNSDADDLADVSDFDTSGSIHIGE